MPNLSTRLDKAYNLSDVRDRRFKDAAIYVNSQNHGRVNAELCEAAIRANTAHGGKNAVPWGLYFLPGDLSLVADPPERLQGVECLEVAPADQEDRRAAKLVWNEIGTQATFSFTPVANLLGLDAPSGTNMRIAAEVLTDADGLPVILLPLGENIKLEGSRRTEVAASRRSPEPEAK